MAKINRSIIQMSGKIDKDLEIVNSKTYGKHGRKPREKESENQEAVLGKNNRYTKLHNDIASEINKLMKKYGGLLKKSDFYSTIQQILMLTKSGNRYILLKSLCGQEINQLYPLDNISDYKLSIKEKKKELTLDLIINSHPKIHRYHPNSHYYEFLFITWDKNSDESISSRIATRWISYEEVTPDFTFHFPYPSECIHWLLTMRHVLGEDNKLMETPVAEAMKIMEAGTRISSDFKAWDKYVEEQNKKQQQKKIIIEDDVERIDSN